MTVKKLHFISGVIITIFTVLHLCNHLCSIFGAGRHIEVMTLLRPWYRNIFVELLLLTAIIVQIFSGMQLFIVCRKSAVSKFEKLHLWTGFYLALFFIIHLSAIFAGRLILQLDTNFYFGVAGLNQFPVSLFFIPYYGLAILSFFGHIASIHRKKMNRRLFNLSPGTQAKIILATGLCITVLILYGLTNQFKGVPIPATYKIMTIK